MPAASNLKRKASDIGKNSRGTEKERSKRTQKNGKRSSPVSEVDDGPLSEDDGTEGEDFDVYDDPMIDRQGPSTDDSEDEGSLVEDDEDPEEVDDEQPIPGPSKPPQTAKKGLYKPPTLAELEKLEAASSTGNTFALQLEALVTSTLLPQIPSANLKDLLSTIHSHILSLSSIPGASPKEAAARLKGVDTPWVGPVEFSPVNGKGKEDSKWTIGWEKPSEILIAGSWGVCGGYKRGKGEAGGVDVVVVMPDSLFSAKDRMSFRYFHKRSHYLAVIYSAIQKLSKSSKSPLKGASVRWENTHGDERRPIIVISAGKEQGLKRQLDIRIHTSISTNVFPGSSDSTSTPLYASSLIQETLPKSHLLHLHRLSQLLTPARTLDSFLALWRIWSSRRGLSRDRGGSGFFGSMALGFVVDGGEAGGVGAREKTKRVKGLGRGLGAWGFLRAAWEFLANTDFEKTPIFLTGSSDSAVPRMEFTKSFSEIFVDPTGSVNIFAGWEKGDIDLLRHHARETLAMLEDPSIDRFGDVFIKSQILGPASFDEFIVVDSSDARVELDAFQQAERSDKQSALSTEIAKTLRRGLGDRARLVHVSTGSTALSIGIIFNPQTATRVIDIGPTAEKPEEGEAFRQLWGEKAELRRFKDGSITESVVWDLSRPEDATTIPSRIVKWLLSKHFSIADNSVQSLTSDPDWLTVVQTPPSARNAVCIAGSEKQGFRPVLEAYETFYKVLKSIDDELPLAILHVTPASELLRYSSVFVPHPIDLDRFGSAPDCLKWIPHADVVMQFESSPRWPDDLAAVQKVKLALLEKVGRVVGAQMARSKVAVVFDKDATEIEDGASLEVLLPQGIALRVRIWHERERTLLERIVEDDSPALSLGTALPKPPRRLVITALKTHIHRFLHTPQHHSAIAPLHHRFPSYSSATRLLKRWLSSHMLSNHVAPETVELLMASIYLDPNSRHIPSSASNGFIRAIEKLASWEWRSEPVLVPIFCASREASTGRTRFPEEERVEAVEKFEKLRAGDKEFLKAAWVVGTERDLDGLRWTSEKPSKVVAGRITVLARATLDAVTKGVSTSLDVKSLFKTPLDHYDFLIHLKAPLLTRLAQSTFPNPAEWESKLKYRHMSDGGVYGQDAKVSFDPAEAFANDIQRLYGDALLVFYDNLGGEVVACLWNPTKQQPRNLKPFLGFSTKPGQSEASLVEINKDSILSEIGRLGEGLIDKIVFKVT